MGGHLLSFSVVGSLCIGLVGVLQLSWWFYPCAYGREASFNFNLLSGLGFVHRAEWCLLIFLAGRSVYIG